MTSFQERVLSWYRVHGRHDLPWQRNPTPYRVWISEIMLQQTQVSTVIPYYQDFLKVFPSLRALASASLDEVLHQWTGLGYYARARNLHRTAQVLVEDYRGQFPKTGLESLPGIGRSTAGAILSLSRRAQRGVILDGNVRRVLSRHFACGDLESLWTMAEEHTPDPPACRSYNQAMMDLGSLVCLRHQPRCESCPVRESCEALKGGIVDRFPLKSVRKPLPERSAYLWLLRNREEEIFLEKRPSSGIWGGLFCPPLSEVDHRTACYPRAGGDSVLLASSVALDSIRHTFTHFRLILYPIVLDVGEGEGMRGGRWYKPGQSFSAGLPQPIKKLLESL